jgi:hypothetical protein
MSAFVEGALALELPNICMPPFSKPLFAFFWSMLSFIFENLQVPFIRFQALALLFWDKGEH